MEAAADMAHLFLSQLQELIDEIGLNDSDVVCKRFFSGAAAYARGKIVASLSPKGLAFKLPEPRCEAILAEGVAVPLRYFAKSPVKRGYVLFPDVSQLSNDRIGRHLRESVLHAAQDAS